jgi:aconitase A
VTEFDATLRVDNDTEVEYLRHDGILPMVLEKIIREHSGATAGAPS